MKAVEYIHSIGVAHRDISLENLHVSKDGKQIKLANFGMAIRAEERGAESSAKRRNRLEGSNDNENYRQQEEATLEKPSYAAPEVISTSKKIG